MPFGDKSPFEDIINELLETLTISDILEMCDITEYQVLEILLEEGHIKPPPFVERALSDDDEELE